MIFIAVVAVAGVVAITLSRSTIVQIGSVTTAERIPAIAFWLIGWLLYWVPTLVAIFRRRIPVWPVALFNLISGWTVVGWFTVLWFATTGRTYEQLSPRASG